VIQSSGVENAEWQRGRHDAKSSGWSTSKWSVLIHAVALGSLGGLGVWLYWPTVKEMARAWSNDPQYSHGCLVPVFAAVLLWQRRDQVPAVSPRTNWWGALLLITGAALWFVGARIHLAWFQGISLLPSLAGWALLLGGRQALTWSWPTIGFLAFMVPLPQRVKTVMGAQLQEMVTTASSYLMQTLGLPAVPEDRAILLGEVKLDIVGACSGLGMFLMFIAVAIVVAVLIRRPWWERIVILVSAIPITLVANFARITLTGVLHETVGPTLANLVFHDWSGWLMILLAAGLFWLELAFLARLYPQPVFFKLVQVPAPAVNRQPGSRTVARVATASIPGMSGGAWSR